MEITSLNVCNETQTRSSRAENSNSRQAFQFTDSRIDTQERGFCPSFPGRFCSCRSAAVVHLKGTSEKRREFEFLLLRKQLFKDSRSSTEDTGFRTKFPGRLCSCFSVTAVQPEDTSKRRVQHFSVALLSARGNNLASERTQPKMASRSALSWVLDAGWTTAEGRLFHAATTQNQKNFCLLKVCALRLKIFLPCPRRVCWVNGGKTC
ncbi:hypothetical protein CSKR_107320 [Clonorchis sinensis]|uniref:Uncharacterized protein n=1 Tax=Clonorchis sinensis TaxID=79923 RepID=A0A3R7H8V7_CLOSI|nr:hypothetical protein CSKR_107320 [Clonorchis sinensis]